MSDILQQYKKVPEERLAAYCIPITVNGTVRGRLRPITDDCVRNRDIVRAMTEWRRASGEWFTSQFPVTEEGTKQWLQHQVIEVNDRLLFLIEDEEWTPIGQIGLIHYDPIHKQCEFDNLLRGRKGRFGNLVIYALLALGRWAIEALGLETAYLNVLANNYRAIEIYKKLGAEEMRRVPLRKVAEGERIRWVPAPELPEAEAEKHLVTMAFTRRSFIRRSGGA